MEELNFMDGVRICWETVTEIIKRNENEKISTIQHEIEQFLFFIECEYNSERSKWLKNHFKIEEELGRYHAIVKCINLHDKVEEMKRK